MHRLDSFACVEVGNGTGYLEDAVVGSGREVEPLHGTLQHLLSAFIGLGILLEQAWCHLCIAVYACLVSKALLLYLTGTHYPFPNACTALRRCILGQFVKGHRGYLNLNIYTVKQGTTYLVQVLLNLRGAAHAGLGRVIIVAARAGVHRSYHHKVGRIVYAILGTGYRDMAVLERLTQHLQYASIKLGQLVTEQNSVMSKADFSWLRVGASTYKRYGRDGVVRTAEGAHSNERGILAKAASYGVYLGGLQTL